MRRVAAFSIVAAVFAGVVAFAAARFEHPEVPGAAAFLFVWTVLPGLGAGLLCLAAARRSPSRAWQVGLEVSTVVLAAAGSVLQVLMFLGLPRDPDTAAHLAPFLLPPVLAVAAVMLLLAVAASTFVVGRGASFVKADRAR